MRALAEKDVESIVNSLESVCEELNDVNRSIGTLRDKFAMAALQGMLAHDESVGKKPSSYAADAYAFADAMLRERER